MSELLEKVELIGENGERLFFVIDAIFEAESNEYAIMSNEEDEEEAIMLKVEYDEDRNISFIQIESDEEFDMAIKEYYAILDEQD